MSATLGAFGTETGAGFGAVTEDFFADAFLVVTEDFVAEVFLAAAAAFFTGISSLDNESVVALAFVAEAELAGAAVEAGPISSSTKQRSRARAAMSWLVRLQRGQGRSSIATPLCEQ